LYTEKRDLAFTLVELLAVIAFIGVLAALLPAAVSQEKAKAQKTHCIGNLHQLGLVLQYFLASHHGYPISRRTGPANRDSA